MSQEAIYRQPVLSHLQEEKKEECLMKTDEPTFSLICSACVSQTKHLLIGPSSHGPAPFVLFVALVTGSWKYTLDISALNIF